MTSAVAAVSRVLNSRMGDALMLVLVFALMAAVGFAGYFVGTGATVPADLHGAIREALADLKASALN